MKRKASSGFTLIEILLVVVIIGILAAIVAPRLVGRSKETRINAAKAQIKNLSTALDMFEQDNGFFPSDDQGLESLIVEPSGTPEPKNWRKYWPKDEIPDDPWGNEYIYQETDDGYDLFSMGPDGEEGTEDDVK